MIFSKSKQKPFNFEELKKEMDNIDKDKPEPKDLYILAVPKGVKIKTLCSILIPSDTLCIFSEPKIDNEIKLKKLEFVL